MGEHTELSRTKPGSNWYDTFRDSIDLKTLIKRDFGPIASRSELEALIVENRVPIVTVSLDVDPQWNSTLRAITIRIRFRNVGTVPAYRLDWDLVGLDGKEFRDARAGTQEETLQCILSGYDRGIMGTGCDDDLLFAPRTLRYRRV